MEAILQAVRDERAKQDAKWGKAAERNLPPQTWLTILMEEVGEAAKATLEGDPVNYAEELVQVAAVAVAALEGHRVDDQVAAGDQLVEEDRLGLH